MHAVRVDISEFVPNSWPRIQASDARCVAKLNPKAKILEGNMLEEAAIPLLG
jgi:hypothetical protein